MGEDYKIQCLVPDLPSPQDMLPFLEEMHSARWYSNFGPLCKRFESEIEKFVPVMGNGPRNTVVSFTSATTALEAALSVLGLRPGARVLVPTLTFPATATAVLNAGFIPVLCDVDAEQWDLSAELAREALKQTPFDAVMPVAVYGKPIDVLAWDDFAAETGLPVVVDAAAALGQQKAGSHIHLAFSLHATKPFSVGEGGLLVTPDANLAERARSWSNFGFAGPGGVISQVGTNAKMGEFYAATGLAQLARWNDVQSRRAKVMEMYREALAPLSNAIQMQAADGEFIPATFVLNTNGRAQAVAKQLAQDGIHTRFWYLPPLYEHPALVSLADGLDHSVCFPVTEQLKTSLIGLPFHAFLTQEDVQLVCSSLSAVL